LTEPEAGLQELKSKMSGPCADDFQVEETSYDDLCNMGVQFMQQSDTWSGSSCFLRAREMDPTLPRANVLISLVLKDLNKCDTTIELLKEQLELYPTNGEIHVIFGQCLSKLGQYEEAIEYLIKALGYEPSISAYYELGNCYRSLGDIDTAVSIYHEASSKFDSGDDIWFAEIGRTLQQVGRFEEAVIYLQLTVSQVPDNAYYQYNLASVYEKMGKFDDAMQTLKRCVELKPELVDAYKRMGNIYLKLGRMHDAVAAYREAFKYTPGDENLKQVIDQLAQPSWWNDVDTLIDELGEDTEATTTETNENTLSEEKEKVIENEKLQQVVEEQEEEEWW